MEPRNIDIMDDDLLRLKASRQVGISFNAKDREYLESWGGNSTGLTSWHLPRSRTMVCR